MWVYECYEAGRLSVVSSPQSKVELIFAIDSYLGITDDLLHLVECTIRLHNQICTTENADIVSKLKLIDRETAKSKTDQCHIIATLKDACSMVDYFSFDEGKNESKDETQKPERPSRAASRYCEPMKLGQHL